MCELLASAASSATVSPPRLQDLAAAREDALWSAVRAVLEEAELARCLAQDSSSGEVQLASFLTELADRAEDQISQLRKVIASVSDLIEPDRTGPAR